MRALRGTQARFGHVLTAMVTPLTDGGRLDKPRAADLARWLLAHGSDGLVVNGTTGESPTTSLAEKAELIGVVRAAAKTAPIIAGAGSNNTREAVDQARQAFESGADGLLSVAPYYNKPNQEGLYRHFRAIAEATPLPLLLYNNPGRTVINLDPATVARLAKDVPNVVGIKEASADLARCGEILRRTPETFDVYGGDDATALPLLALGGAGTISVVSHVLGPDLAAMHRAWFAGDAAEAARLFLRTLPVTRALFCAPSPGPTKYALSLLGHAVGSVRLPLIDLDESEQGVVREALRAYGLLSLQGG